MNILKPLTVTVLAAPLALAGCVTDPAIGQRSANKTAIYGLDDAAVYGIVGASAHGGKDVHSSALACGTIGTGIGGYMDYQAKRLHEGLANTDVKVEQQGNQIRLVMPENVTFATNGAILSANTYDALTAASKTLVRYPGMTLTINGHTNNAGSDAISDPLPHNHAQPVASFLQLQGVVGSRLTTAGHGSYQPVTSNAAPGGRARNRRVETPINPDQDAIKAVQR